jgi:hypothetical protein
MLAHLAQKQQSFDADRPLQRATTPKVSSSSISRSQLKKSYLKEPVDSPPLAVDKNAPGGSLKPLQVGTESQGTPGNGQMINQKLSQIRNSKEDWPEDKKNEWNEGFSARPKMVHTPPNNFYANKNENKDHT